MRGIIDKCIFCRGKVSNIKCVNDVNQQNVRLDFYKCATCKSTYDVEYNTHTGNLENMTCKRGDY